MWNLYLNKKVISKRSNVTYKKITSLKKGTIIKKSFKYLEKPKRVLHIKKPRNTPQTVHAQLFIQLFLCNCFKYNFFIGMLLFK